MALVIYYKLMTVCKALVSFRTLYFLTSWPSRDIKTQSHLRISNIIGLLLPTRFPCSIQNVTQFFYIYFLYLSIKIWTHGIDTSLLVQWFFNAILESAKCTRAKGILFYLSDIKFFLSKSFPNFAKSRTLSAQNLVRMVDVAKLPTLALIA